MKVNHTQQIVERDKTIATLKEENESQRKGLSPAPRVLPEHKLKWITFNEYLHHWRPLEIEFEYTHTEISM